MVQLEDCSAARARSDSPGTVLPLFASVLCSELSGKEEAVHSAGHTAAEPSVKQNKTAFPSTCHLRTVWSYKYEHRLSENIMTFSFFVTQTQAVRAKTTAQPLFSVTLDVGVQQIEDDPYGPVPTVRHTSCDFTIE